MGLAYEGTHCQAAEKYPSRPIQVVIGYEPGSTDQALKPFIDKMAEYLGQPMNFVFKPGASGSIGSLPMWPPRNLMVTHSWAHPWRP